MDSTQKKNDPNKCISKQLPGPSSEDDNCSTTETVKLDDSATVIKLEGTHTSYTATEELGEQISPNSSAYIDLRGNVSTSRDETVQLNRVETENNQIAVRFQQIMEMFDNFTRNLESLEMPATSYNKNSQRPNRRNRGSFRESCPRVHRSRYAEFMMNDNDRETDENTYLSYDKRENATSSAPWRSPSEPENDSISSLTPRHSKRTATVLVKDNITTMSDFQFHTARDAVCSDAAISCQTSLQDTQSQYQTPIPSNFVGTSGGATGGHARHFNKADISIDRYPHLPLKRSASLEDIRDSLIKISPSPSAAELTQPPCETTFHTIHIEARNSPSPSEMLRPPLCIRCWNVITSFFAAVCICVQVNRDCLFCLGFFAAFVVSASFLTAFFYRTLNSSPDVFHENGQSDVIPVVRDSKLYII